MTAAPDLSLHVRLSLPEDGQRLVGIWRSAVLATHHFLDRAHFELLDQRVCDFLPGSSVWIAETAFRRRIGFMGLQDGHIESLFVDAQHRGTGVGRRLVDFAAERSERLTVDVNEQNVQAVGFYRHLGFRPMRRSPDDGQGLPYPILHMQRD